MKENFIEFLEERKVKEQFENNLKNISKISLENYLKANKSPKKYVSGAFDWRHSPEGLKFWGNVFEAWKTVIKDTQPNQSFKFFRFFRFFRVH